MAGSVAAATVGMVLDRLAISAAQLGRPGAQIVAKQMQIFARGIEGTAGIAAGAADGLPPYVVAIAVGAGLAAGVGGSLLLAPALAAAAAAVLGGAVTASTLEVLIGGITSYIISQGVEKSIESIAGGNQAIEGTLNAIAQDSGGALSGVSSLTPYIPTDILGWGSGSLLDSQYVVYTTSLTPTNIGVQFTNAPITGDVQALISSPEIPPSYTPTLDFGSSNGNGQSFIIINNGVIDPPASSPPYITEAADGSVVVGLPMPDDEHALIVNYDSAGTIDLELGSDGAISGGQIADYNAPDFSGNIISIKDLNLGTVNNSPPAVITEIAPDTLIDTTSNGTATLSGIDFFNFFGTSGTLKLEHPIGFAGTISSFIPGDTIDLVGLPISLATVTYGTIVSQGKTFTFGGIDIYEANGQQFTLNVDTSQNEGSILTTIPDGNGGTDLVWTNRQYQYDIIQGPTGSTVYPLAINDMGQVAGNYIDASGASHGFIYNNGAFDTVDVEITALNDSGEAIGKYGSGYVLFNINTGDIQSVNTKLASPDVLGLNNAGQVIGEALGGYSETGGFITSGFGVPDITNGFGVPSNAGITTYSVDYPYESTSQFIAPTSLNDLDIATEGSYTTNSGTMEVGLLYDIHAGTSTSILMSSSSINDGGTVSGSQDFAGVLYDSNSDSYSSVVGPSSASIERITGINNSGAITGTSFNNVAFIGTLAAAGSCYVMDTTADQSDADITPIAPLSGVAIADTESSQTEAVTVTLSNAADGVLTDTGIGAYNVASGIYSVDGTPAAVTAALDGLTFQPTAHQAAAGSTVTTSFNIHVTDTSGSSNMDDTTSVVTTESASTGVGLVATLTVSQQLEAVYIAYFNRAADSGGDAFWSAQSTAAQDGGASSTITLTNIANSFAPQPESIALYPFLGVTNLSLSSTAGQTGLSNFISGVYGNLFDRAPDVAGQAYWVAQITSGSVGLGAAALAIANGAMGSDAIEMQNKITVALDFTTRTAAANLGKTTPLASSYLKAASSVLSGIDGTSLEDASVTAGENATTAYISNPTTAQTAALAVSAATSSTADLASPLSAGDVITVTSSNQLIDLPSGNHIIQFLSGTGADTLVLCANGIDQVSGFNPGSDVLDFSSLLSAANVDLKGNFANLESYVSVIDQGTQTLIDFDPTGLGGGSTVAVLQGLGSAVTGLDALIAQGAVRIT